MKTQINFKKYTGLDLDSSARSGISGSFFLQVLLDWESEKNDNKSQDY
jgi:hypothetical protein